jgi:uncharacterized protein YukE
VGVLDGFESTWSNARLTFGEGTPQEGAQYDNSGKLRQLQSNVQSANAGSGWTGSAADSYSSANEKQARVIGGIADVDQRLRTEIDRSAQVVTAGRQNLDAVRQWVYDAAATVPPGENRDRMLYPIVSKGAGEIADILKKSNGDLSTIAGRIQGLGGEYQMLGGDPKQGGPDGQGPDTLTEEERKKQEEEIKKRAQADVKAALDGDKNAIQRVQNVLNTISPQQQTGQPKLNPEQQAYLSQMQAQQKLRSVDQLQEAANKGAKGIMADSWQLMSNPKLEFPKTDSVDGALQGTEMVHGGFNQLPDSVQSTVNSPGIQQHENLQKIADIVNGGAANGYFQHDTDLDRGLMHKAADMMEDPKWRADDPPFDVPGNWPWEDHRPPHAELERVAQDIFHAVGNDHQVVHDAVTGHVEPGNEFRDKFKVNSDHFMYNLTHEAWDDKGASAGSLFDWMDNSATGPEGQIAGETARSVSEYIGHHPDLNSLNGGNTVGLDGTHKLGEVNPLLVRGFAEGLSPYVNNIAGTQGGLPSFGGMLDDPVPVRDGTLPEAKNVFSVLNGDPEAAKVFNGAALGQALLHDTAYAQHPDPGEKPQALYDSATLRGLVDVGMTNNIDTTGKNQAQIDRELYGAKSAAFDYGLEGLTKAGGAAIPGVGSQISSETLSHLGPALKDSIIGPPPAQAGQPEPLPRFASERAEAEMLNTLNSIGHPIADLPPEYRGDGGRILSYEEMYKANPNLTPGEYANKVNTAINNTLGFNFQDTYIKDRYDQVTANRTPDPTK